MAWRQWLPRFTNLIGVDLGTSRTRVWSDVKGLIIDQPTAIAVEIASNKVLGVGQDAADMQGRVASGVTVHQPVQQGKLYDDQTARAMLKVWLQEVLGFQYIFSPIIMASVPAGATQAEHQALTQLFYDLGAREVFTIAQPLAAAIGAGVPIADASGTLVCQIGAGIIETAMISLGSTVASESDGQAGDRLDQQLQFAMKQRYGTIISRQTAQQLKRQVIIGEANNSVQLVIGQHAVTNAPTEIQVPLADLSPVMMEAAQHYLLLIQRLLSRIPPELTSDVLDKGMLLSGGMAQLAGLDSWLTRELGVPVAVVEESDTAVIRGISTALEYRDEFKQSLGYR